MSVIQKQMPLTLIGILNIPVCSLMFFVRFPGEKVHCLQNETDVVLLLRQVADIKKRVLHMRGHRACLLAEQTDYIPHNEDGFEGTLKVRV